MQQNDYPQFISNLQVPMYQNVNPTVGQQIQQQQLLQLGKQQQQQTYQQQNQQGQSLKQQHIFQQHPQHHHNQQHLQQPQQLQQQPNPNHGLPLHNNNLQAHPTAHQTKAKENKNFQQEKYYKDKPADFSYLLQNGYKVYKELGRGGYGVVYKAYEQQY